jgi:hypothetical protein
MTKTIKHGPFLWVRRDSGGSECWDVELPRDLGLTFFCVKNYGGEPQASDGFTGWRLVSGGPLTNVGGWTTRDAAIADVTPYLIIRYAQEARAKIQAAQQAADMLRGILGVLSF